jgi:hypothetical protein
MLISEIAKTVPAVANTDCDNCHEPAVIQMHGYGDGPSGTCNWCADCALQVVRKTSEDLCELLTKGGRHG